MELKIGCFKIYLASDCSDTEALYPTLKEPNRWIINIWFSDPEQTWFDLESHDGSFLIKSKLFDGSKEEAIKWANDYLLSIKK